MNLLSHVDYATSSCHLIKVHVIYDLIVYSQVVLNRGHGFSKRLNPAGVYRFYHRYHPAHLVRSLPGKAGKWAQLNLYLA